MTAVNRATLYGYFQTGLKPSQSQFADLIDSCLNISTASAQVVTSQTMFSNNLIVGTSAIGPLSTTGFLYIPTTDGVPTQTPDFHTGTVPLVYNTSANTLCVYNGAWKSVTLS